MKDTEEKPTQVYAAAAANLVIAISKIVAAVVTGSSAMLSEGIHSIADTGNQLLLLFGLKRSRKPPDEKHAFGYGQEIYFWGFIVAIVLFSLGGGMSIYEGVRRLRHGSEISSPMWNYIVLGVAAVAESISFKFAMAKFRQTFPGERHWWRAIRNSKDPSVFVVLAEDTAALLGIIVAAAGIFFEQRFNSVVPDAIAAIIIGCILAVVAVALAAETKGLLLGESADPAVLSEIQRMVSEDPAVLRVEPPLTMHLGPHEILLNMAVQFRSDSSSDAVIQAIDRIETAIRSRFPEMQRIFIEASFIRSGESDRLAS